MMGWIFGVICEKCGEDIIISSFKNVGDYSCYCSNPLCPNHNTTAIYYDQYPDFAVPNPRAVGDICLLNPQTGQYQKTDKMAISHFKEQEY